MQKILVGKLFNFSQPILKFFFQVVPTTDHIDTEKLKAREQIKFLKKFSLFEDRLHDHGVSSLSENCEYCEFV